MYIIFHMLLCLSISFIYISASPSVSTSPAHLYQISEAHWKLAREEVWKDRNSTQSLQNVLFSGAGMLRRRKKSTTLFFFFLCSSITFTNYFPPFTWLWPHSCFWQMEKHRQAAANQVPPKPASLAPASQAQSSPAAAKASWFLHNEQKSPLASQNSQHIPHSGFGNRVRSLGEKKLQEKFCVPVPSRIWWGWIGGSAAEGQPPLVQLGGPPGPIAHILPQIRDQLPKHLHRGNWQTLHKSAVSPPSSLEGAHERWSALS